MNSENKPNIGDQMADRDIKQKESNHRINAPDKFLYVNQRVTPRMLAATSLIASEGYRRWMMNRTMRKTEHDLIINFKGAVHELMFRATYIGSADGLTATDHRGPLGGGPGRSVYLQDFLVQGQTGGSSVPFVREIAAATNAAEAVADGDDKPEQDFDLEEINAKVGKAAVTARIGEETFADYLGLQTFFEARLVRRVKLRLESILINGTGSSPDNILGFQEAGLPTVSITTAGSLLEAVQEAIAQIESNGFTPSFIFLNPTDKRALYSSSSAAPLLVWENGFLRLLGVPIIGTAAVTAGTGLVGDGSEAGIMYKCGIEGVAYRTDSSKYDQDNLVNGLVTILAEVRAALVIQSLGAFVEIVA